MKAIVSSSLVFCAFFETSADANLVRVFILAGQSNMVGPGSGVHLTELLNNRTTAPTYQHLRTADGQWVVRDDVFISDHPSGRFGGLTMGYGFNDLCFGPELEFGQVVGNFFDDDVLLIKASWGGTPLAVDWRPPQSGISNYSYCSGYAHASDEFGETFDEQQIGDCRPYRPLEYGSLYRETVAQVQDILANLQEINDTWTEYSLHGFVWFQGWNDIIDPRKAAEYGPNLANLIRDIRLDLEAPGLPFIIGELGQQGVYPEPRYRNQHLNFRRTQRSVAYLPEFRNDTMYVKTSPYVVKDGETFNGDYHYYGRADTFFHIGHAFAQGVLALMASAKSATWSIAQQQKHQDTQAVAAD